MFKLSNGRYADNKKSSVYNGMALALSGRFHLRWIIVECRMSRSAVLPREKPTVGANIRAGLCSTAVLSGGWGLDPERPTVGGFSLPPENEGNSIKGPAHRPVPATSHFPLGEKSHSRGEGETPNNIRKPRQQGTSGRGGVWAEIHE